MKNIGFPECSKACPEVIKWKRKIRILEMYLASLPGNKLELIEELEQQIENSHLENCKCKYCNQ